jgi:hypothetical protein
VQIPNRKDLELLAGSRNTVLDPNPGPGAKNFNGINKVMIYIGKRGTDQVKLGLSAPNFLYIKNLLKQSEFVDFPDMYFRHKGLDPEFSEIPVPKQTVPNQR